MSKFPVYGDDMIFGFAASERGAKAIVRKWERTLGLGSLRASVTEHKYPMPPLNQIENTERQYQKAITAERGFYVEWSER